MGIKYIGGGAGAGGNIDPGTVEGQLLYWNGTKWVPIDESNLMWDNANKRLGIGTTNPGSALEVVGDVISKGTVWTSRTSAADNNWYNLTYGNGLFVAVASSGTGNRVMTSPDGRNWTIRASAADNNWVGIAYGNGLFVAVANSGTGNRIMTSPDGSNWTIQASAADNAWREIAYGNGLFVAVASSGTGNRVMTSPDGRNWTIRASAADNLWMGIAYGNGLFVATAGDGTGNRVMTSPDGENWTIRASAADNLWYGITYGNGLFVAVAGNGTGNRVMTSPDGENWTIRASAADNIWLGVTYGNGLFVAISWDGAGNRVMTSGAQEYQVLRHDNILQGGRIIHGDLELFDPLYHGEPNVDGTYRVVRNGADLEFSRRESGIYNLKMAISGTSIKVDDILDLAGNQALTLNNGKLEVNQVADDQTNGLWVKGTGGGTGRIYHTNSNQVVFQKGTNANQIVLDNNGKVGFGTVPSSSYQVEVGGSIRADNIWIKLAEEDLAAATDFEFLGLDGNTQKMYKVIFQGTLKADGIDRRVWLRPNRETTGYNFFASYTGSAANTESETTAYYMGRSGWTLDADFTFECVIAAMTGRKRVCFSNASFVHTDGSVLNWGSTGGSWKDTTANITRLWFGPDGGTVTGKLILFSLQ